MTTRKRIGLALGSGSSRGWAHIGAIEALEEAGIAIDFIAGCSVGAYVGALYACGSLDSLKNFVMRMDGKRVFSYFDVVFPQSGLLDGNKKLKELFCMHTEAENFDDLQIPLRMVATDLKTGKPVVIGDGSLLDGLRATMSYPGLFAPVKYKDYWLVDGGLTDPVPVGVARGMGADVVIGVDLNSGLLSRIQAGRKRKQQRVETTANNGSSKMDILKKFSQSYSSAGNMIKERLNVWFERPSPTPNVIEVITSSINIMQERITRINLAVDPPDILVQPRLSELKMMDFDRVDFAIEEGYLGIKHQIDEIKALLGPESSSTD